MIYIWLLRPIKHTYIYWTWTIPLGFFRYYTVFFSSRVPFRWESISVWLMSLGLVIYFMGLHYILQKNTAQAQTCHSSAQSTHQPMWVLAGWLVGPGGQRRQAVFPHPPGCLTRGLGQVPPHRVVSSLSRFPRSVQLRLARRTRVVPRLASLPSSAVLVSNSLAVGEIGARGWPWSTSSPGWTRSARSTTGTTSTSSTARTSPATTRSPASTRPSTRTSTNASMWDPVLSLCVSGPEPWIWIWRRSVWRLEQKAETAKQEKNRAAVVALNAEIRRTKAKLLEEDLPKLQRLAVKKVAALVPALPPLSYRWSVLDRRAL